MIRLARQCAHFYSNNYTLVYVTICTFPLYTRFTTLMLLVNMRTNLLVLSCFNMSMYSWTSRIKSKKQTVIFYKLRYDVAYSCEPDYGEFFNTS